MKGQSLFEVVLALSIVALITLAIVILATISIRNSTFTRNKTVATKYSQEALEWLRGERDTGWATFYANRAGASGTIWCLNTSPPSWPGGPGACSATSYITGTVFLRQVTLTQSSIGGSQEVSTAIKVSWKDGSGTHESSSVTSFTNYKSK